MSSILLGILIFSALVVAGIYFLGVRPARMVEQWAAGLSNGGHFPKRPEVKGLYWLLPVHRELQAVSDKIERLKADLQKAATGKAHDDFLNHCILASVIEGILVVDGQGVITVVNSEFINMFQLTQSPLQCTILEVIRDKKLQSLITDALATGRLQSGRITRPTATEVGRPPTLEVSAVPIRTQKDRVYGVIVLFLPPPDRTRILQSMKRHSQRLDNLVGELMLAGAASEKPWELKKEKIELAALLEEVINVFGSKPENSGVKTSWQVLGEPEEFLADSSYLELALIQLLINLSLELNPITAVALTVDSGADEISFRVQVTGSNISDAALQRAFGATIPPLEAQQWAIIGNGSGLALVRKIVELHNGQILTKANRDGQTSIVVRFPLNVIVGKMGQDAPNQVAAS